MSTLEFPGAVTEEGIRIPKPDLFRMLNYQPQTPEVWRFHQSTAPIRMCIAPARTSKSYSTAKDIIGEIIPHFRIEGKSKRMVPLWETKYVWIIGTDYNSMKEMDYVYSDLVERQRYHRLPYEIEKKNYAPNSGNVEIVLRWGDTRNPDGDYCRTIIQGKSMENRKSLQGEQIYLWVQSEAAEHPAEIFERYGRTRSEKVIWPTTPKLRALWLKERYENARIHHHLPSCGAKCDPDCPVMANGVESFVFTPAANPKYDWTQFWREHAVAETKVTNKVLTRPHGHDCFDQSSRCVAMKDLSFGEQFGGLWTGEADRVLPFSADGFETNVIHELPPWWEFARYYVGFDYGNNHPSCVLWFAVGSDGTICVYREIYERRLLPDKLVRMAQDASENNGEYVEYYVPDPQRPEVEGYLRELGLPVFTMNRKVMRDRKSGYMRLINHLGVDPEIGRPQLFFLSERAGKGFGCPHAIREFQYLRRKDGVSHSTEEFHTSAIVGADHAVDVCRYFLASRPRAARTTDYDANWEVDRHIQLVAKNDRFNNVAIPSALAGRYPHLVQTPER